MTANQLQTGIPVVVPEPLTFEGVNAASIWAPTAVVVHCFHQGPPVAAGHIADDAIDVEQHQVGWGDGC